MNGRTAIRAMLAFLLGGVFLYGGMGFGCNPSFIQSTGGSAHLPTAPGDADYIMLRLVNSIDGAYVPGTQTPVGVGYLGTYRIAGSNLPGFFGVGGSGLVPGEDFGILIPCNVTTIALGDVNNPGQDGAWLIYADDVGQPLVPLDKVLQNGVDFRCGDVVTFITHNSPNDSRSYAVDYQVQSGRNVKGPFTGPDTFNIFEEEAREWEQIWANIIPIRAEDRS